MRNELDRDTAMKTNDTHVLLVEDSATQASVLKRALEAHGWSVQVACDGVEALRMAQLSTPDIVVSDIHMPRMDGHALCRAIKSDPVLYAVPVVLLTSLSQPNDIINAINSRVDGYVLKQWDYAVLIAKIESVLDTCNPVPGRVDGGFFVRFDGETYTIEAHAQQPLHLLLSTYEIAVQQSVKLAAALDKLREKEERFRVLFESSQDAIMTLEPPSWSFTSGNSATVRMFRAANEAEFTAHEPWRLSPERQPDGQPSARRAREEIEKAMCDGSNLFEWTHKRIDGDVFPALVLLTRVDLGDHRFLQATVRDITERKRAAEEQLHIQTQLHDAQKLAAVGTLARGMAHEINNPIMGVINYAQLIRDEAGGNAVITEFADEIMAEGGRVATLAHALLAFTGQRDAQQFLTVPLAEIIDAATSAVAMEAQARGISLVLDVHGDVPAVSCRQSRITQVLTALLTNAMEALDERYPGGDKNKRITIRAEGRSQPDTAGLTEDSEGRLQKAPDQGSVPSSAGRFSSVHLTIEDCGSGLAEDIRRRMFEPFFTTKDRARHSGLGLWICQSIVEEHGGVMSVESDVGQWTRFHVDLPGDAHEGRDD